jgi:leader peptidase (prepilin peptidase)/N-methyltransferase
MPTFLAFELPAFLLGLLFGSFLNVCISRLPEHRSISKPRSHCPQCKETIRWYDNIPILSFAILRGRCRHCSAKIPWRYSLVEFATGIWFAITLRFLHYGLVGFFGDVPVITDFSGFIARIGLVILGFLLIGLLVMDWQTHKLPDAFTLTGTLLGFMLVCTQAIFLAPGQDDIKLNPAHSLRMSSPGSFVAKGNVFLTGPEHLVFGRLAAIVGAALILIVIRALYKAIRHREGLGLGDVKLLAMIAAFLGFWPAVLALFCGVILCTLYAITLLARRKAHTLTHLPLGTFLSIGGLIAALFGTPLIAWYSSLL